MREIGTPAAIIPFPVDKRTQKRYTGGVREAAGRQGIGMVEKGKTHYGLRRALCSKTRAGRLTAKVAAVSCKACEKRLLRARVVFA